MDALKRHYGAAHVTNVDVPGLGRRTGKPSFSLAPAGYTGGCLPHSEQLMSVTGINRELLITDLLLRIEHYLQPGALCYRFLNTLRDIMFLVDSHCHLMVWIMNLCIRTWMTFWRKPPHAM